MHLLLAAEWCSRVILDHRDSSWHRIGMVGASRPCQFLPWFLDQPRCNQVKAPTTAVAVALPRGHPLRYLQQWQGRIRLIGTSRGMEEFGIGELPPLPPVPPSAASAFWSGAARAASPTEGRGGQATSLIRRERGELCLPHLAWTARAPRAAAAWPWGERGGGRRGSEAGAGLAVGLRGVWRGTRWEAGPARERPRGAGAAGAGLGTGGRTGAGLRRGAWAGSRAGAGVAAGGEWERATETEMGVGLGRGGAGRTVGRAGRLIDSRRARASADCSCPKLEAAPGRWLLSRPHHTSPCRPRYEAPAA